MKKLCEWLCGRWTVVCFLNIINKEHDAPQTNRLSFSVLKTSCVCFFPQGTQIELSIGVVLGISTMAGKRNTWPYCNWPWQLKKQTCCLNSVSMRVNKCVFMLTCFQINKRSFNDAANDVEWASSCPLSSERNICILISSRDPNRCIWWHYGFHVTLHWLWMQIGALRRRASFFTTNTHQCNDLC